MRDVGPNVHEASATALVLLDDVAALFETVCASGFARRIWFAGRLPPDEKGVPAVARAAKEMATRDGKYIV